jgi:hypothetical protein
VDFHPVSIDVERVRAQMASELNRGVTDIEVIVWLRRCGFILYDGRWIADTSAMRAALEVLGNEAPERQLAAT